MKTFFITLIGAIFGLTTNSTVAQPTITVYGDLETCSGESVILCIEPAYEAYFWNTGQTTNCISILESGDYYAVLIDGSLNIDSSLFFNPTSVIVHNPVPILSESGDTIIVANEFEAYQWFHNGDTIQGATNPTYKIVVLSGYYYVEVTDSLGCKGRSFTIEIWPQGIDKTEFELLNIFPNPTSDKIHIDFGESINDINFNVFNPLGGLIHSRQLNGIQYFNYQLPEANGIYLIQLLSADGKKRTWKVVKE